MLISLRQHYHVSDYIISKIVDNSNKAIINNSKKAIIVMTQLHTKMFL